MVSKLINVRHFKTVLLIWEKFGGPLKWTTLYIISSCSETRGELVLLFVFTVAYSYYIIVCQQYSNNNPGYILKLLKNQ